MHFIFSATAISHNIHAFRHLVGDRVLLMPVIKSNAYGHGMLEVARLCDKNKEVNRLCVVNMEEALELIAAGIRKPLVILSIYELDKIKIAAAIKKRVAFPLYTFEQAKILNAVGERVGKKAIVHLKIDVGTSRIGIRTEALAEFIKKIKKYIHLHIEGIFSHFASSEENGEYTKEQYKLFEQGIAILKKEGIVPPLQHIACSAAATLHHYSFCNAIRFGISLYGLHPSATTKKTLSLKPALSWHSTIIQVKNVPTGAKVSYGGTHITKRPTKLAIIPVGYWDGYDRGFSNKAKVIVKGKRCPILGRVCMNMSMIDVTEVKNPKAGDRVTLLGKNGKAEITADELAAHIGTINYEVVTRVNPLIPRVFKK